MGGKIKEKKAVKLEKKGTEHRLKKNIRYL